MGFDVSSSQNFGFKCLINRPAICNARAKCIPSDANNFRPFTNGLGFAFIGKKMINSAVALLLLVCAPSAIVRTIAKIVVESINCISSWRLSHVGKKVRKIKPAITDGDTTASIILVGLIFWIITALFYSKPNNVKPRFRLPMFGVIKTHVGGACGRAFITKAATGSNFICLKMRHLYFFDASAITQTIEVAKRASIWRVANHNQSPESGANKIGPEHAYTPGTNVGELYHAV